MSDNWILILLLVIIFVLLLIILVKLLLGKQSGSVAINEDVLKQIVRAAFEEIQESKVRIKKAR